MKRFWQKRSKSDQQDQREVTNNADQFNAFGKALKPGSREVEKGKHEVKEGQESPESK